jgi:hypothetical protein
MSQKLNKISRVEVIEQVASLFIQADALVVDLANAPGYPDMMVLVKDCMPLFVFCRPDDIDSPDWQAAKRTVEKNLEAVNATWFDASEVSDLDWVLGEVLHRTKPGEIRELPVQLTAEQQGFEFAGAADASETVTGALDAPPDAVVAEKAPQPAVARKAWMQ